MRTAALISGCLHLAGILMIVLGLPFAERELPSTTQPIPIEVVTVAEETNPPKGQQVSEVQEEPAPAEEPKPAPPPPPKPEATPSPAPEPEPETEPEPAQRAEPIPEPVPEPETEVAAVPPEPEPEPERQPKPAAPPPPPGPRVEAKPTARPDKKPPDQPEPEPAAQQPESFDSVLNDVLNEVASNPEEPESDKPPAPTPGGKINDPQAQLSISEIDAVRRQIARCWNIPAGAKDARSMVVEIKVDMRRDATVGNAAIMDRSRMASDHFYRAMAESALRAVLNPRCQPYPLPQDRFDIWRTMTLRFDPREMFR